MTIAERIKRLRELFEITSNELAEITGIHPVSIRKYETSKMVPGIEVIDKMCDALNLPRMIFEGFPKQHTNYKFTGDFYQQLFLLLDNGTFRVEGGKTINTTTWLSTNKDLDQYISIEYEGKTIPLSDIKLKFNTTEYRQLENYQWFLMYLDQIECAQKALQDETWNEADKGETKEEYSARLHEHAEQLRFDLMLTGHSWKQYMKGYGSYDQTIDALHKELAEGGTYYSFVDKLEAPISEKEKFIKHYEDQYISEMIDMGDYEGEKSALKALDWYKKKAELIEQYKKEHPDYHELAKEHALKEAKKNQ